MESPGSAPAASVVVVTRDLPETLVDALESVRAQDLADLQTIVVLNRADDAAAGERLRCLLEATEVVVAGTNLGFAAGVNLGIRRALGRYVLLLNDDARAEPGWAKAMVEAAERDPAIGMCASKVLLVDPPGRIDTTGHLLFGDGLNRGRGRLEIDRGQYDHLADALFPSGAAALYRREMLDALGGFDERFFAYGEDTELGIRARLAGWKCRYVPSAVAHHHGSRTAGAYSAFKAYHVERNRVWIAAKHFPLGLLIVNPLIAAVRYAVQLAGALRGRGATARFREGAGLRSALGVGLRSQWDALKGLGTMLAARRELRHERRLSLRVIYRWLQTDGLGLRQISWGD